MSPRHEGHEKREPRQRPPAPADQQLATLRARLPRNGPPGTSPPPTNPAAATHGAPRQPGNPPPATPTYQTNSSTPSPNSKTT